MAIKNVEIFDICLRRMEEKLKSIETVFISVQKSVFSFSLNHNDTY